MLTLSTQQLSCWASCPGPMAQRVALARTSDTTVSEPSVLPSELADGWGLGNLDLRRGQASPRMTPVFGIVIAAHSPSGATSCP